ncbi:MAG: endopeptidase La, partial [Acidobacteria bacterium]|nr:endopeptidase La [Acidobacteriota bacterium]
MDAEREPAALPVDAEGDAADSVAVPPSLPILPLRDTVLFPGSFMPLAVARKNSIRLIDEAVSGDKLVGVFTQRDPALEAPAQDDLFPVGTLTHVHKMFKLADGSQRLIVQGLARVRLEQVLGDDPFMTATVTRADETARDADRLEIDALLRNIRNTFEKVISLSPLLSDDLQPLVASIREPGRLADFVASSLTTLPTTTRQQVLEMLD